MCASSAEPSGFDVGALVERLRSFRDARDWGQFHSPGHLAVAIAVEAAELLEHFLWINDSNADGAAASNREALAEELADILIYLIYLADRVGIDLWEAAERKVDRNELRFPTDAS
jgi:dCTP diphosphatase